MASTGYGMRTTPMVSPQYVITVLPLCQCLLWPACVVYIIALT